MNLFETGSVSNLNLDLSSLNDQLASVGVPIEVLDGFVRNIKVEIPWSNLMKDSCTLTLRGLELTIQMADDIFTENDSEFFAESLNSRLNLIYLFIKNR